MSRQLLITDDFNSVRRCATEAEMREVARILISAMPDCVALDAASPDLVNYNSSIGLRIRGSPFDALFEAGCDPFGFTVDRLKEAGIQVLANIRMNDHHGKPAYWSPWEQEHVSWSLGQDTGARDWKSIGALRHMDYAIEGVRAYRLSILAEILRLFDVDGIQLDWGRTAPFVSEPKTENARLLTEFVRSARNIMDQSRSDDRRLTLGALLPWDLDFCNREGLEVQEWVDQGLVDFLSPGEWYYADWNLPLKAWAGLVNGSRCKLIPFTPGNVSPYQDFEYGERSRLGENRVLDGPKIRAIADNFAAQGTDGFAFYNFYTFDFGQSYPELRHWVEPDQPTAQSRHHLQCRRTVYHPSERDAFDLGLAFARVELNSTGDETRLPFRFSTAPVGKSPLLRCAFINLEAGDDIEVTVNKTVLKPTGLMEGGTGPLDDPPSMTIWEGRLPSPPLVTGENTLGMKVMKVSARRILPIRVGEFEILVEGDH